MSSKNKPTGPLAGEPKVWVNRGYKLREDLIKACKHLALETKRPLYEVMEEALIEYLQRQAHRTGEELIHKAEEFSPKIYGDHKEKQAQEVSPNRQSMKDIIEAADHDDISIREVELKLSDTWEMFISHLAKKLNFTIEHIREDPDREPSFYHTGSPGALTYDIIVSGHMRGVPIAVRIDILENWYLPLATDAVDRDACIPFDTWLWPVRIGAKTIFRDESESIKEMMIDHPLTNCRDGIFTVLFKGLKPRFD